MLLLASRFNRAAAHDAALAGGCRAATAAVVRQAGAGLSAHSSPGDLPLPLITCP